MPTPSSSNVEQRRHTGSPPATVTVRAPPSEIWPQQQHLTSLPSPPPLLPPPPPAESARASGGAGLPAFAGRPRFESSAAPSRFSHRATATLAASAVRYTCPFGSVHVQRDAPSREGLHRHLGGRAKPPHGAAAFPPAEGAAGLRGRAAALSSGGSELVCAAAAASFFFFGLCDAGASAAAVAGLWRFCEIFRRCSPLKRARSCFAPDRCSTGSHVFSEEEYPSHLIRYCVRPLICRLPKIASTLYSPSGSSDSSEDPMRPEGCWTPPPQPRSLWPGLMRPFAPLAAATPVAVSSKPRETATRYGGGVAMLPGLGGLPPEDAAESAAKLGSGEPPSSRRARSMFEIPDEQQMIKDGEAMIEKVSATVRWLRTEGTDVRCTAHVLGCVSDVFPTFGATLDARQLARGHVVGVWVVPPFIVKDLIKDDKHARLAWRQTRGRLGPFLKNDLWRRIDREVQQGRPVDWKAMGLQQENLVVVKVRLPWRQLTADLAKKITRKNAVLAARTAYKLTTRENVWYVAVTLWPFKWSWLIAWGLLVTLVRISQLATASVVPVTVYDDLTLLLANAACIGFSLKYRSEADEALGSAQSFKIAGSVALRKGKLDIAVEQYSHGAEEAAKLARMTYLNRSFMLRGAEVRIACLNNAAIVRLKQREWAEAVTCATSVLEICAADGALGGVSRPLAQAKALFRRAVAEAKLDQVKAATEDLMAAQRLVPEDREVVGLLRVLLWGEERRKRREAREAEDEETAGDVLSHEEAARAAAAYAAVRDPKQASEASSFTEWAGEAAEAAPPAGPSGEATDEAVAPAEAPTSAASAAAASKAGAPAEAKKAAAPAEAKKAAAPAEAKKAAAPAEAKKAAAPAEAKKAAAPAEAKKAAAPAEAKKAAAPAEAKKAAAPAEAKKAAAPAEAKKAAAPAEAKKAAAPAEAKQPATPAVKQEATAKAAAPAVIQRFALSKDWLTRRLTKLLCQGEDGDLVATTGVRSFTGEACTKTNLRGAHVHVFDLSFEIEWQARVAGVVCEGRLVFGEVSSELDVEEYEISIVYDASSDRPAPQSGTEQEQALAALIGPLRPKAALAADGVLTQHIWRQLISFKESFPKLEL
ncbi:hypothetical protein AB1Y20_004136 [Prymnesium parvum]|uniref:Activator of Hsp90 ATPase AHSA1-like N-terminal domain-containing protein n=1 Tax=Prymnesium parvum TaxID=97485 RepID=A0AB34J9M4_PRYPA